MANQGIQGADDLSTGGGDTVLGPGIIIASPPGGPSPASTAEFASIAAPFLLWAADTTGLTNAQLYLGATIAGNAPPTDLRAVWLDTSSGSLASYVLRYNPSRTAGAGNWLQFGAPGPQGIQGIPGAGAYSYLSSSLTAGAVGATGITATVATTAPFATGQYVEALDSAGGRAYYVVTAVPSSTTLTLTRLNWDTSTASTYSFTAANAGLISITGTAGPGGTAGPISTIRKTATTASVTAGAFGASQTISVAAPTYFQVNDWLTLTDGAATFYGQVTAIGSGSVTVTRFNASADTAQAAVSYSFASGSSVYWTGAPGVDGGQGAPGTVSSLTTAAVSAGASGASVSILAASTAAFTVGGNVALTDSTGARADYTLTSVSALSVTGTRLVTGQPTPPSGTYIFATGSVLSLSGAVGEPGPVSSGTIAAIDVAYDDSTSGLAATNAQSAIDELAGEIAGIVGGTGFPASGAPQLTLTGLVWTVTAGYYWIQSKKVYTAGSTGTLATADPTNPRMDVIELDTSGNVIALTGTPAASPGDVPPEVDINHLGFAPLLIAAGATAVSGVTTTTIFDEGTEWTPAYTGAVALSTANPYQGTHDVLFNSAANGDHVIFTAPSPITPSSSAVLTLYVRLGAALASQYFAVYFESSTGATVGSRIFIRNGNFGLNGATTGTYQKITIPNSAAGLNTNGAAVQKLYIGARSTGGATITANVDFVVLQDGVAQGPGGYVLPPATASTLGGVKIGANVSVTSDGTISVAAPATVPVMQIDTFSPTGSSGVFTLSHAPLTPVLCYQQPDGLKIAQSSITSVSGTTLTLNYSPATGTNTLEVVYWR